MLLKVIISMHEPRPVCLSLGQSYFVDFLLLNGRIRLWLIRD